MAATKKAKPSKIMDFGDVVIVKSKITAVGKTPNNETDIVFYLGNADVITLKSAEDREAVFDKIKKELNEE